MAVHSVPDESLDEASDGWAGERVFLFRQTSFDQSWHVEVAAMEFLRGGAEDDVRQAIAEALRAVPGVEEVREDDREVWRVTGTPSGEAMAQAVDEALEPYADVIAEADGSSRPRRDLTAIEATTRRSRIEARRAQHVDNSDGQLDNRSVGQVGSSMRLTLESIRYLSETSVTAEFFDRDTQSTVSVQFDLEFVPGHPLILRAEPDILAESGGAFQDLRSVHNAVVGFLQAAARKSEKPGRQGRPRDGSRAAEVPDREGNRSS
jgi:hypothetical protein